MDVSTGGALGRTIRPRNWNVLAICIPDAMFVGLFSRSIVPSSNSALPSTGGTVKRNSAKLQTRLCSTSVAVKVFKTWLF